MKTTKKHVENIISQIVREQIDKALSVSDKRRKEFKRGFSQVFAEADAAAPPPPPDPAAAPAPASADPSGAAPDPAAPPAPGGSPGDPAAPGGGVTGGEPGAETGMEDDGTGMDDAGGAGGGGFGGFGGGGGGGGGGSDEGGAGAETGDGSEEAGEPSEPQGDPIEAMVSGAQELLNQTNDPNMIVKSLKGQIQTVFAEPEHALGLIKALYDTQDSILQAVAQRLYLFIKTSRPI